MHRANPEPLNPMPHTLNPEPLNPMPYTLNPEPLNLIPLDRQGTARTATESYRKSLGHSDLAYWFRVLGFRMMGLWKCNDFLEGYGQVQVDRDYRLHMCIHTYIYIYIYMYLDKYKQINEQMNKQVNIKNDKQLCVYIYI